MHGLPIEVLYLLFKLPGRIAGKPGRPYEEQGIAEDCPDSCKAAC